jgi:hypothetical protein
MKKFLALYNIVRRKNDTVASVLSTSTLNNVSFKRAIVGGGGRLRDWLNLVSLILLINLNDTPSIPNYKSL